MADRVLLVKAGYQRSQYDFLNFPVGLGYLSETLSKNGISHEALDLELGGGYKKLAEAISRYKPDMVGYSLMSFQYKRHYSILNAVKRDFPKIKIVAGGPHVSVFKKKALLDCEAMDIGVIMEGEETLSEICKCENLDEIAGIIYRKPNGDIVQTKARNLISELDTVPFPRYKKFKIKRYPKIIPIVTSRGCPHQCVFCPIASTMGSRFRARSAANVVNEIEYWYKDGFRDFSILDDVFNFVPQRVHDICNQLDERKLSGLRICCSNGIRADKADRTLLQRMKRVGFYYLAFGVETTNNAILKTLKKGERIERIEEAVKESCELGFWVELFFLIGSPGETRQDIQQSIKFALKYPICDAQFYNLIPFPSTELYKWIEEKNYFLFPYPEYLDAIMHHVNEPLFQTPELSRLERKRAFQYAKKIIRKHTIKRRLRLERRLIKEKLRDYYSIEGVSAELISYLYCHKWIAKIIRLFTS